MQKGAAESITESIAQGSETQFSPGENAETGVETAFTAGESGGRSSFRGQNTGLSSPLSDENPLRVPCAPHESDPGHTYRLARSLQEPDQAPYEPFPADLTRVPVPDRVLDSLDELSGCAVRLCLLMTRASYSWVEELGEFRASSRWFTTEEIEEEAGGLGMSRESLRRAAGELAGRGWIARRKREGCATAYRWRLSVPRSRYTPVPAPLLHAHQRFSHSALTLLLCALRATWGWTARDGETLKHKRSAELSASELRKMTGLSRPTLRGVQEELRAKGALYIRRKHAGAPYEYSVDPSFFRAHLQKSCPPTNREKNSNKHTREEETTPENVHTKGESRRRGSAYQVTEEWEEDAIRLLCAHPIEMAPRAARDLVIRRAKSVVEGAVKAFRRRRSEIKNPAGWMHSAIENLWFAPTIPNKTPDVRQSSGTGSPIAQAFENLTEKQEGWEWGEEERQQARASEEGGLDVEQTAGITHPEMCDLIDTLSVSAGRFETVDRPGENPLFVPTKELANWAYFNREEGSEAFRKAARRIVNLRARHEGRESPISGE